MKTVRAIVLGCLLLLALCVCGTVVLGIMEKIFAVSFENIIYHGFQTGFAAWLLLSGAWLLRCMKR